MSHNSPEASHGSQESHGHNSHEEAPREYRIGIDSNDLTLTVMGEHEQLIHIKNDSYEQARARSFAYLNPDQIRQYPNVGPGMKKRIEQYDLLNFLDDYLGPLPEQLSPIDAHPGATAGLYDLELKITGGVENTKVTLPKLELPSVERRKLLEVGKQEAIAKVRKWYEGQEGTDKQAQRDAELAAIEKQYSVHQSEGPYDDFTYTDHEGNKQDGTIQIKDQLDAMTPAIEASYKVREEALAAGKSINEAYDLGAEEYKRLTSINATGDTLPHPTLETATTESVKDTIGQDLGNENDPTLKGVSDSEQTPPTGAPESAQDTPERTKHDSPKKVINKIGRALFIGTKTAIKGTRHSAHAAMHVVSDTSIKIAHSSKDAFETAKDAIKANVGTTIEDAKQLIIDYKVDLQMTGRDIKENVIDLKDRAKVLLDAKNEHEALREAIEILFQPLGDDERDAALQNRREKRFSRWTDKDIADKERQERRELAKWARARLKAIALKLKRLRQEERQAERDEKLRQKVKQQYIKDRALNVVRIEDNAKVNYVIKDLRRYLAEKHPVDDSLSDTEKAKDYYSGSVDSSGLLG